VNVAWALPKTFAPSGQSPVICIQGAVAIHPRSFSDLHLLVHRLCLCHFCFESSIPFDEGPPPQHLQQGQQLNNMPTRSSVSWGSFVAGTLVLVGCLSTLAEASQTPYIEQSFFFDWTPAGEPYPIPVTREFPEAAQPLVVAQPEQSNAKRSTSSGHAGRRKGE
jgi:hypothetical protein